MRAYTLTIDRAIDRCSAVASPFAADAIMRVDLPDNQGGNTITVYAHNVAGQPVDVYSFSPSPANRRPTEGARRKLLWRADIDDGPTFEDAGPSSGRKRLRCSADEVTLDGGTNQPHRDAC